MAEKRPLGPLGPMMYGKLPRLEPDPGPGHSLPLSASSQDSCNYKGAYFSCPIGGTSKAGSERLASWTPYPSLYPTGVAGSPCQAFLEKYRTIQSTGFLASKYTSPYPGDAKQAMSEGPSSPWTQLAQPLGPPCQDAVAAHYPLPPPPQALPCPPSCHPEKQGSYGSLLPLPPLGAHKGAAYQAGGLGSPYLRQQAPQAPYMPPLGIDSYSYSSAPLPAPSPGLKLEPPLAPRCPLDFVPQTLGFPYARDDLSLYGASPGLGGTPPSHSQNSVQLCSHWSCVECVAAVWTAYMDGGQRG